MNDEIVTLVMCGVGLLRRENLQLTEEQKQRIQTIGQNPKFDSLFDKVNTDELALTVVDRGLTFIEENM